ncbi:3',5'-cyclic-nucleotide phosphodiesterase [Helicobacter pylori]|uniref:3',5'-cyclic-nucleotide phosphodiesterase n=1 Tax=Helicobacter pylori TaxID=210 RepID=UPI000F701E8A|nr:3',5'-cyclic-nucleotide phosphodiesterase [Helicobacter pylori]VEJ25495.1 3'-to-5' oligoribonuclease B [Helicobacter pylori]
MQVYHLSHIDLDGYACQLVSKQFFKNTQCYNANYGREVSARIYEILNAIAQSKESEFLILISDLNLNLNEVQYLQDKIQEHRLQNRNIQIQLLDHHISGKEVAESFHWYFLDTNRCATKIVYEFLKKHYAILEPKNTTWLEPLVEMVNSVDIWDTQGYGFELGKVCMRMINQSSELNRFMFDDENRDYKLKLLEEVKNYLFLENAPVAYDNDLFRLKKIALGGDPDAETMDNISSNAQTRLLSLKKHDCSVYYQDKKGFLSYSMGGISVLANLFLTQNPDFDFYIDVNAKGNVSLRANGNCDVCELSQMCFNGGGHRNASGGKIDGFRESFNYRDIKEQIEEIFNNA